jgi:hypothetical protein
MCASWLCRFGISGRVAAIRVKNCFTLTPTELGGTIAAVFGVKKEIPTSMQIK